MSAPALVWRLNPRIRLTWRDWGHDSVAFESLSGGTYQFDPLAAAVLSWFEEQPCSHEVLCSRLAEASQGSVTQDLREGVTAATELLRKLGWIEPMPPP